MGAQPPGRQLDAATRTAIEKFAEDQAEAYWRGRGWEVTRVGHLKRGYDLECGHPEHGELHVEVKGTQTAGEEVVLTPNEVRHNQPENDCPAQHALFVVTHIAVEREDVPRCSGGRRQVFWPWTIAAEALTRRSTPTGYQPPLTPGSAPALDPQHADRGLLVIDARNRRA